jgi:hypothetical protein
VSKLFDYLSHEKLKASQTPSLKRQLVFEKMGDVSMDIRWSIKSSFIPFIGKFLPTDSIRISKKGDLVMISFSVIKVKKFSFNQRPTTVVFDFSEQSSDSLTAYSIYLVDHQSNTICDLSKSFSLPEKKLILKGMIMNKLKKVKQNEGDHFKNKDFINTNPKGPDQVK